MLYLFIERIFLEMSFYICSQFRVEEPLEYIESSI